MTPTVITVRSAGVVGPQLGILMTITAISIKIGTGTQLIDLTQPLQPSYTIGGTSS